MEVNKTNNNGGLMMELINKFLGLFRKKPIQDKLEKEHKNRLANQWHDYYGASTDIQLPKWKHNSKSEIGYVPIHNFGKNLNEPKENSMKGAYTSPEEFFSRGIKIDPLAGIGVVNKVIEDNKKSIKESQDTINELARRSYRESGLINGYDKEISKLNSIVKENSPFKEKRNANN